MDNFIEEALRTESSLNPLSETYEEKSARLLHAAIGLVTESGEFIDALKKFLFYGRPLDLVNLKEELGDILWYAAVAMSALDTTFEEEMDRVIRKLRTRYPEKFTTDAAINRDLFSERNELEK